MTIENDIARLADAADRIATALEKLAGVSAHEPAATAESDLDRLARRGEPFGVPVVILPGTGSYAPYAQHFATLAPGAGQSVKLACGAAVRSRIDLARAVPYSDTRRAGRCGAPGCAAAYRQRDRLITQNH